VAFITQFVMTGLAFTKINPLTNIEVHSFPCTEDMMTSQNSKRSCDWPV